MLIVPNPHTEHMEGAFAMASDFGPRIADLVEVAATRLPEAPALDRKSVV